MRSLRHLGIVTVVALTLVGASPGGAVAQGPTAEPLIRRYQAMLARKPRDAGLYARLADAYVRKSRETGDSSDLARAEQAIHRALALEPTSSQATRQLAYVLYSRHDFEGAAREAQRAIDLDNADAHARGVLGDAWLEVGRYDEARIAYARMIELGRDLYSLSRRAGLRQITGDSEGAAEDLAEAIAAGRASSAPPESLAWAQWQLGSDRFAAGDLSGAETRYREALLSYPGYYRAAAGLAQVRAAQGRFAEAIEWYRKALDVVPMPEYAAALGDVYVRIGRIDEARKQYALVEYIGRLTALNRVLYNRELVHFYADHDLNLPQALELARRELEARQDIYAYDGLAWALYKSGKAREAVSPMTEALRLGTRDARLHFHAGMIFHAVGEPARAREHLERALALNPYFSLLQADIARETLSALGARER